MLNISVASFYDNFDVIFKGSEDMATKIIENWPLSTTPLSTNACSSENLANIRINLTLPETRVPGKHFSWWHCGSIFIPFHV